MILILGGTTEGRCVVKVCDEASKPYYYSTKGDSQEIVCANGIRLTGALSQDAMAVFCQEKGIQLIIDAAHPFAAMLHQTVALVSDKFNIPVVRYERNYPKRDENLIWCDSYDKAIEYLESQKINNLLALTGVNTLPKLKPYWLYHNCWFRILDRADSRELVVKEDFPLDKVLYYQQGEDDTALFEALKPGAIITKESGDSGGFGAKVASAMKLNIPVIVIKRPQLSPRFISVDGENGLRKKIEQLAPSFFDLKTGYTTGACATAATKAALIALLIGECQSQIRITLPNGEELSIPIAKINIDGDSVSCCVVKDAGDDPDVTHGREIWSTVKLNNAREGVSFLQGKGVGVVTLPGLGLEVGGPAINSTPRQMIEQEVFKVLRHNQDKLPNQNLRIGVDVTISVPDGEEIAKKTFNPKLGIVGGISIIGTSGIVKPFSSEAFIRSIEKSLEVAKALKCETIVINSGAKSEKYVKSVYPDLCDQAFVHYGNFIGETIKVVSKLNFKEVVLGIMIGKAVKLAEGSLDTHSKNVVMNKDFLCDIARQSGCSDSTINDIQNMTLARQLWKIIPQEKSAFFSQIIQKCYDVCKPLFPKGQLTVLLIGEDGNILK